MGPSQATAVANEQSVLPTQFASLIRVKSRVLLPPTSQDNTLTEKKLKEHEHATKFSSSDSTPATLWLQRPLDAARVPETTD